MDFTAIENIIMPLIIKGDKIESSINKAKKILKEVKIFNRINHFPNELSGRVITAVNVMTFGGVFLIQYLIGEIINFFPTEQTGAYSSEGFFWGFGLAFLTQFLSFIWYIFPRNRKVV